MTYSSARRFTPYTDGSRHVPMCSNVSPHLHTVNHVWCTTGCWLLHHAPQPGSYTIRFLESQCSCTRCRVGVTYCDQGIGLCASGTGAHAAGASHFAAILIPALAPSLHSRIPTSAIRVSHGGATAAQSEAASAVLWVTDHRESTCRCGRVLHAKRPHALGGAIITLSVPREHAPPGRSLSPHLSVTGHHS